MEDADGCAEKIVVDPGRITGGFRSVSDKGA
jgi:hypothetical protein